MNNKGFTLVEILAAVTILGILTTLAIAGYTGYIDYSKNKAYKTMAKSAVTAAEEYIMENPGDAVETKTKTTATGKKYVFKSSNPQGVSFETLINEGYLNNANDPDNKGNDCKGRVTIGLIEGSEQGALDQYMYVVDQCCKNYCASYTYTIEVDSTTGESRTLEEVSRNNVKCENAPEEIEYCYIRSGGGFNTSGIATSKCLSSEHCLVSKFIPNDIRLMGITFFKKGTAVYDCFASNGNNCSSLGTSGVDYYSVDINSEALPSDVGCYYAGYWCLSGESEVEVYDKKKKKRYKKKLKDLTPDDLVLAWDFEKREFVWIEPLWIKKVEIVDSYYLVKFSDGTELEVIGDHRIFNCEENKFTRVISETPIGTHTFNSKGEKVELVSIEEINKQNTSCNVITKKHINIFVNGILTSWAFNNLYPIKDMKYQKQENNTFTRDELKDIPEEFIESLRLDEIPVELMGSKQETLDSIKSNIDKIIQSTQRF